MMVFGRVVFFFSSRRRHTRFDCDWSSEVCSSDLDATLAAQLWAAALCASSRIARGSGFRNRRMFAACVDRTLAALAEISFYLEVGCAMDLISKDERSEERRVGQEPRGGGGADEWR